VAAEHVAMSYTLINKEVIDQQRKEKILDHMPLHQFGRFEELSPMICLLASPEVSYITGQPSVWMAGHWFLGIK
jgi:NAD(P)-dependent dehydrogenase (short-subunit alcohol dehydrogenase family)